MGVREVSRPGADEAWDAGLDVVGVLFSTGHAYHDPLLGDLPPGPAGVRAAIAAVLTAMPDARVTVEEQIEEGDALVLRWSLAGTHTGPLLGMAPTGRRATMRGVHVFRFHGSEIAETWAVYDALGLLDQLGLVTLGIRLGDQIAIRP
jgi:predicted ester cyclase